MPIAPSAEDDLLGGSTSGLGESSLAFLTSGEERSELSPG